MEEEKFCWVWRAKLTILVALRKIFLLADLLIAAEIWLTQCFIIFRTFDFLTSMCIKRFPNLRIILNLANVLVHDLKFELLN